MKNDQSSVDWKFVPNEDGRPSAEGIVVSITKEAHKVSRLDDGKTVANYQLAVAFRDADGNSKKKIIASSRQLTNGTSWEEVDEKSKVWLDACMGRVMRALEKEFGPFYETTEALGESFVEIENFPIPESDDILTLYRDVGLFACLGEVAYLCLSYGEYSGTAEDGKPCYNMSNSEYFHPSEIEKAKAAMEMRKASQSPFKSSGLGYSLDEVKNIENRLFGF